MSKKGKVQKSFNVYQFPGAKGNGTAAFYHEGEEYCVPIVDGIYKGKDPKITPAILEAAGFKSIDVEMVEVEEDKEDGNDDSIDG